MNSVKKDVSKRVETTKKEIEQLKNELEKLISSGTQPTFPKLTSEHKHVEKPKLISKYAEIQPQPSKTNIEIQHQYKKTVPQSKKQERITSPSKKVRNYDVAEARDFIKKQREKRAEQLKAQINKTDDKLDLKKQKLLELQMKTRELVNKNVQLKRERSKSREKDVNVRIDKTNPRHVRMVSKSQERNLACPKTNSICPRGKSSEQATHLQKVKDQPQKTERLRGKSVERATRSEKLKDQPQKTERPSRTRTREKRTSDQIDPNFLYPPDVNLSVKNTPTKIDFEKTVLPPCDPPEKLIELPPKKQVLEHSIMTDVCLKDTKETQTSHLNGCENVAWMQPCNSVPYPYNFINTVKRKLQFAVNSPQSYVDVGVQKSTEVTPQLDKTKSKEEIKELLIRSTSSDLKSFASHKNLDLKVIENLELVPNNMETVSKNLFDNYIDSESDTSKNIPEISSESLSLDKVKGLKLEKSSKPVSHTDISINTETSNGYTSDFQKDSESQSSTVKTVTTEKEKTDISADTNSKNKDIPSSSLLNNHKFKNSDSFKSLLTDSQLSKSSDSIPEKISSLVLKEPSVSLKVRKNDPSKSFMKTLTITHSSDDITIKSLLTKEKVSKSSSHESARYVTDSLNLKEPTVSLSFGRDREPKRNGPSNNQMKNITIRPATSVGSNVNEVHLKFEAEVRLLNDFNESFKQFVAVQKAYENIKNKKESNLPITKILQNVDTQTSFMTKTSTNITTDKSSRDNRTSSINFSRGSDIMEDLDDSVLSKNNDKNVSTNVFQSSSLSTDWDLGNWNDSSKSIISTAEEELSRLSSSNLENFSPNNCASLLSLNMFDQLIKDEDTRIQQLKAIIKIREQALLDRTKGELVWLEIQKKQLIETGRVEEASLLKKKQRGIILKHEQERNEIKKLKQMQKEASEKRKNTLKQQRNLIKSQLSTEDMLAKITVKKRKERRSMGPLKVVQSCSESIHSETSISLKSSGIEDVLSITSKSVRISEESELDFSKVSKEEEVPVVDAKRTLLMREAALQKRRKAAEELLKWHRKLLEEEKKINELEVAATSVIGRKTTKDATHKDKYKFNGKQLNQLWKNMTGSEEKKFVDNKLYVMSQIALERLCKSARQYANKNKKVATRNSEISSVSDECKKSSDDVNYSSVFEPESVQEIINSQDEKTKISSISELIDNFSRIEDEISTLSKKSEEIVSLKEKEDSGGSSVKEVEEEEEEEEEPSVVEVVEIQSGEEKIEQVSSLEEKLTELQSGEENIEQVQSFEDIVEELEEKKPEQVQIVEDKVEVPFVEKKIEESESSMKEETSEEPIPDINEEEELPTKIEDGETVTKESASDLGITEDVAKNQESLEQLSSEIKESAILSKPTESSNDIRTSVQKEEISSEKTLESSTVLVTEAEEKSTEKNDISLITTESEERPSQNNDIEDKSSSFTAEIEEKTQQKLDIKKRVSEILADANLTRGDKSPRLQDLYVTAYDVTAPNAPVFNETVEGSRQLPTDIFGSEAEELWRKQLAIEQEIKQIELQQKEQIPYVYMREIPNKPPPPYTPPSSLSSLPPSILPSDVKEITEIASYSSKVLYKAYQNKNLDKVKFSENGFKLFSKVDVTKICAEFVFNICRDIARDHYKQFESIEEPSWLVLAKRPQLAKTRPQDSSGLERVFNNRLKELFGFKKVQVVESAIVKWGRKKRDHVDEVLVIESQEEESQWTNFDKDELIVKNQVTDDIMKMLIDETTSVFANLLKKKTVVE